MKLDLHWFLKSSVWCPRIFEGNSTVATYSFRLTDKNKNVVNMAWMVWNPSLFPMNMEFVFPTITALSSKRGYLKYQFFYTAISLMKRSIKIRKKLGFPFKKIVDDVVTRQIFVSRKPGHVSKELPGPMAVFQSPYFLRKE